ncbi:adenylyltransferase/cytidyltransferase family protein [Candidatus Pacearchaeota archaeon]|nr:adenylyltransferase/cytidyltransferase family protein [Candidatus Pacearchaeota archaeon]
MILSGFEELKSLRKKYPEKKIVACSGGFDLTHAGHILFFEDCKSQGDILVVLVGSDKLTKMNKGDSRPILNENIRLKTVDSFKPVDYCLLDNISDAPKSHKGIEKMFMELRPNSYIINDDSFDIEGRKLIADKFGVSIVVLNRIAPAGFENISTSKIIEKIINSK